MASHRVVRNSWQGMGALAAIALGASGCGSSAPYELAPVAGVVTLDGEPVAKAQISFQPKGQAGNTTPGPGSAAHCDDAGRFVLMTIRDEPGAVVGEHEIRIYSHRAAAPSSSDVDVGGLPKEMIPERYNYKTTLTFEVPANGTDKANFELTSDP